VRHSVNLTALYELPYGTGKKFGSDAHRAAKALLGGWQLGEVWNFNSGLPFEVRVVRPDIVYLDPRNNTYSASPIVVNGAPVTQPVINVPGGGNFRNFRRADYVGGNPFLQTGDKRYFLNPAAFAIPAPGRIGNLGRNVLHGPILSQFDLTLQKQFAVSEKAKLEFRGEIYNLFNRAISQMLRCS
jgi:TonB dependent receptor.